MTGKPEPSNKRTSLRESGSILTKSDRNRSASAFHSRWRYSCGHAKALGVRQPQPVMNIQRSIRRMLSGRRAVQLEIVSPRIQRLGRVGKWSRRKLNRPSAMGLRPI
jgi:hypothetical protein